METELGERLRRLEMELEALQRIKTQEDYDEGARLHALHNAPWVKGQYSHLEFQPYTFQAFPMAIYGVGYLEARRDRDAADLIPAFGQVDTERAQAILVADRELAKTVKKVGSEAELRKWLATGQWFETPGDLVERAKGLQRDIEVAAAHRAYEDRNMGAGARREIEAFDDAADGFVAEVPEMKRKPKGRTVTTEAAIKAAGGLHGDRQAAGRGKR
jgi:hypothetical protein